jgi:hypothetical protein
MYKRSEAKAHNTETFDVKFTIVPLQVFESRSCYTLYCLSRKCLGLGFSDNLDHVKRRWRTVMF